jgi:hypothetical protein
LRFGSAGERQAGSDFPVATFALPRKVAFSFTTNRGASQEYAFGLLKKVYAKRAKLRGEQAPIATAAPMALPESGAKLQTNIGVPNGILAGNDPKPDSRPVSPWNMPAGAKAPSDASPVFQAWLEHEGPEPET